MAKARRKQHSASGPDAGTYERVHADPKFHELRRRHRRFVLPVALLFLGWYFGYVLLADYAHDFMSTKVAGNITVGLLFGLGQFASTFAITLWYVRFANNRLDPLIDEIAADAEAVR